MSVYKRTKRSRIYYTLFTIAVIIVGAIAVFCYQLSLHIDEMSRSESKLLATRIINTAIEKVLSKYNGQQLICEKTDLNGQKSQMITI